MSPWTVSVRPYTSAKTFATFVQIDDKAVEQALSQIPGGFQNESYELKYSRILSLTLLLKLVEVTDNKSPLENPFPIAPASSFDRRQHLLREKRFVSNNTAESIIQLGRLCELAKSLGCADQSVVAMHEPCWLLHSLGSSGLAHTRRVASL